MFDTPPRAVLLDAGETLLYAPPSTSAIAAAVAGEAGLPFTAAEVHAAWNGVEPEAQTRIDAGERSTLSTERSQRFWFWFYGRLLTKLGVPQGRHIALASAFYERFTTLDTWDLYDDALVCLNQLRQAGVTLALVSNWESWLESLLHHRQIHHYFDALAISGQVGAEKPDAAIFHAALGQSGASAEEAVHVGDSVASDVEGARAVGIRPVLLDRSRSLAPQPDVPILHSLTDLPALLGLA
ncbi:MAG: hypothetical protein CL878_15855 [Dehalococcoidia bacterium]|nr:hypothetical protein [Dehalococcoidia bacterium]